LGNDLDARRAVSQSRQKHHLFNGKIEVLLIVVVGTWLNFLASFGKLVGEFK